MYRENKPSKTCRAPATRNPERKKEARMCVYTSPYDGQVKHL